MGQLGAVAAVGLAGGAQAATLTYHYEGAALTNVETGEVYDPVTFDFTFTESANTQVASGVGFNLGTNHGLNDVEIENLAYDADLGVFPAGSAPFSFYIRGNSNGELSEWDVRVSGSPYFFNSSSYGLGDPKKYALVFDPTLPNPQSLVAISLEPATMTLISSVPSPIPLPASIPLLAAALGALGLLARKRRGA